MIARCVLDRLVGQKKAAGYLKKSVREGTIAHAYLFVGPPGTGKKSAAKAFACAIMCGDDGCGACSACNRIKKGVHPDVQVWEPEGTASYLLDEQIRPLIRDIQLAPVESSRKVYVLAQADLMSDSTANAFLKTLEEPPPGVTIILLAPHFESVLPTIASRCMVVRFSQIAPQTAEAILAEKTGAAPEEAKAALAATGGVLARAVEFLDSSSRREARVRILAILKDLPVYDGFDVLKASKDLLTLVNAPLEEVKIAQAAEVKEREEIFGKSKGKALEIRHKRELTARERESVGEVLSITESWLRDCLALSQHLDDMVVNIDVIDAMYEVAAVITPPAANRALAAVREARRRISYNVSSQLAIDAMLFDIREVLLCPRS